MKNRTFRLMKAIFSGFLTLAFSAFGFGSAAAHDGEGGSGGECEAPECRRALTAAKKATAKYHNFQRALDDGFVRLSPCVAISGRGAMGFHYGHFGRLMNPNVDPAEPEVLLYIPGEDGSMRLVGLEYVVPLPLIASAPALFGRTYDFSPQRQTYELHVWAWRRNPAGIFAPFNPKLECPPAE